MDMAHSKAVISKLGIGSLLAELGSSLLLKVELASQKEARTDALLNLEAFLLI